MKDNNEIKIIHTMGFNNCGGRCIINAHVQNGKIIRITSDESEGSLQNPPLKACGRGYHYAETYLNREKRIQSPLMRDGERGSGKFREISWTEAIDYITKEWIRIKETYGVGSRYVNYGWGVSAMATPIQFVKRLLALDGGYLDYYNSYSTACINATLPYLFGTKYTGSSMSELCRTKLIILWGHNPAETRFDSSMYYLKEAQKRGIPIICVDPRYHDTAKILKAKWIPIRPTTDAAMFDAMAYVIITRNLYDQEFINKYCQGFTKETMPQGYEEAENYFSYVLGENDHCPKTPEWAERITGVPKTVIEELAIQYATTKPAVLMQGYGPQRNGNGEQTTRGAVMLACLTGNVGKAGGWAGGSHTIENPPAPQRPEVNNPYAGEIPVFGWIKAVKDGLHMGKEDGLRGVEKLDSNIKMIFSLAGNTLVNQHGNINETTRILKDTSLCECIICSDLFMTPSAKYADLILPGVSFLEMNNITPPWEVGNFFGATNKVVEPLPNCRFEYDWLKEIARNIGLYDEFTQGHETVEAWLYNQYEDLRLHVNERLPEYAKHKHYELPSYEQFKEAGIYRYPDWPVHIAFSKQIEDIENNPFPTPSGKIEIFSETLYQMENEKIPGIPKYIPTENGPEDSLKEKYPLQLTGYHTKRRCHSIHDHNEKMENMDPQTVHIHSRDALKRKIQNGDLVRIYNQFGSVIMKASVRDDIMEGVTAIAQGAWYTPNEKGEDCRGNINVLTSSKMTPLAKGNPQHTNLVEIEKIEDYNKIERKGI